MTHRWLRACAWGNVALLALLFAVTRRVAERSPITTLLLYLPQVFYAAPLLALFPWAAARRDRQALLANSLAGALLAGPFMGLCLPLRLPWSEKPGAELRVMTFNIHDGWRGQQKVLREVRAARPDLLLMVEAAELGMRRDRMLKALSDYHVYHADEYGLASRYPIREAQLRFPVGCPGQGISATIEAPFGPFSVIGMHLAKDEIPLAIWSALHGAVPTRREAAKAVRSHGGDRARVVAQLDALIASTRGPLIVLGDFNTPPDGLVYRRLGGPLQDVFAASGWGWGYTFPATVPLLRIDHIFASQQWEPRHCWVGAGDASFHRPVIADLWLREKLTSN